MDRSEAFPSKYVSKSDLITDEGQDTPIRCHIQNVVKEQMPGDEGTKENVMYFSDFDKPFVLKLSNWMICENEWGRKSEAWTGKLIELFWDPSVMFGSKKTGGRRIRIPGQATAQTKPQTKVGELLALRKEIHELDATKLPAKDSLGEFAGENLNKLIANHAAILEAIHIERAV
jgi:hypothetical protein